MYKEKIDCAYFFLDPPFVIKYLFLLKDTGFSTPIKRMFKDIKMEKTPFASYSYMSLN